MQRPTRVTHALWLLWGSLAIAVVDATVTLTSFAEDAETLGPPRSFAVVFAVFVLVLAWITWNIGRGRNWARTTLLVLTVVSVLLSIFQGPLPEQTSLDRILEWAIIAVEVMAVYLLFTAPSRPWFRSALDTTAPERQDVTSR